MFRTNYTKSRNKGNKCFLYIHLLPKGALDRCQKLLKLSVYRVNHCDAYGHLRQYYRQHCFTQNYDPF